MTSPFGAEDYVEHHTFTEVDASTVALAGVEFFECRFVRCRFTEGELSRVGLDRCRFTDCDLSVVKLRDVSLSEVAFLRCKMIGVDWSGVHVSALPGALEFHECILDHSSFSGLTIPGTVFDDCTMRDVDLSNADLTSADLRRSDLHKATFRNTDLTRARLAGAHGYWIDLAENRLRGAQLSLPEAGALLQAAGIVLVDSDDDRET